jgi:hypothetical protein
VLRIGRMIGLRYGTGLENGIQQAREERIELRPAQLIQMGGAVRPCPHQSGIAQDAKVVGHTRFRSAAIQLPTSGDAALVQLPDDG